MKKPEIGAVETVRAIRDRHAADLKGKTPEEIMAFYNSRERARQSQPAKSTKKTRRTA
jgi:hypothetical protein